VTGRIPVVTAVKVAVPDNVDGLLYMRLEVVNPDGAMKKGYVYLDREMAERLSEALADNAALLPDDVTPVEEPELTPTNEDP